MMSRQSRIDHNSRKASIQSYETTLYSEGLDDGAEEPMQISPGSFDRPDVPHMLMSPPPEEILRVRNRMLQYSLYDADGVSPECTR